MFGFFKSKSKGKPKKTADGRSVARVKAGKRAWNKKSKAEKKAVIARLKRARKAK